MPARIVWMCLVCLCLAVLLAASASASATAPELPLGPRGLPETRMVSPVAPGVTYTRIERGFATARDFYTVDVAFTATRAAARALRRRLRDAGYAARVERVRTRASDDPRPGPLGYLVRTGAFAGEPEAESLAEELVAAGFPDADAVFTGEDGRRTTGPWVLYVLEIDPAVYGGSIVPALATDVIPGREPLTTLAGRSGALAALNGGYFVISEADGT
jgi:hypothetical protein